MNIPLIRVVSDLHLEGFWGQREETLALNYVPVDERDKDSILVLAGDISSKPEQLLNFIGWLIPRFQHVVFIPGNHEYYGQNYDLWNKLMTEKLADISNLSFALGEVKCKIIHGVRFVLGTLWGDGGKTLQDQGEVGFCLNDFRLIKRRNEQANVNRLWSTYDMMAQFKAQRAAIEGFLDEPFDGKTVVVTHHLPSRRLVSKRFWPTNGSDGANGGFVGECDLILASEKAPALWIHGHTHDTIDTYMWSTHVVCNPAGYRGEYKSPFNSFMNSEGSVPKFVSLETSEREFHG